ncbi:MAG: hypothetical protein HYZ83_05005, partial [Candidatus Omnitrophica bacterium]|nr:hypothetical protein [Candidatus Omnitrophota bacterium]
ALKRRPFAVKLNLEEFISLINPDLKKDDLKRDPELVIQLAAHQLAIPYDIPLFVVSLEDGGAVAIYQTDGVIRRTLNDSVQWLLEHARFFKRIIRWFYNLLSPPKWRAISLKAPSVAITNTIGAGDAFVGSLAVTLSEQPEWTFNDEWVRKAVAGAVAAGTIALTKPVTEVGSQEEIASLLTELKETVQNVAITHPKRQRKEKQNDHDIETPRIRDVVSALLRKDPSIWPLSNQDDIVKWLGWFDAPEKYADPEALMQIESLRDRIAAEGFEHIVLVGTGGSALGADTIYRILPSTGKGVHDLTVLSLTHPRAIQRIQKHIQSNLDKTLFIIGTKSGQTLDTVLAYRYLRKWLTNRLGGDFTQRKVSQQIVVITDPGKTIDAEPPRDVDFRKVFINDPAIGGRFSVFSYFGIVPAGLAGVDVRGFLDSARQERSALIRIAHGMDPADNRVFALYPMLMQEFNEGRNKFTFIIPEEWQAFGAWLEQLLNESIPKKQMVPIAVTGEAQLSANHYDEDRVFIRLELGSTGKPFRRTSRGLPEIVFPVADSDQLGALMFDWMVLTALLGHSLKIHPFNQPGVALSKTLTEQALAGGLKEEKPMTEFQGGAIKISLDTASQVLLESRGVKLNGPNTTAQQVISGFLATMPAKTYAAVLAYEDEGVTGILSRIRRRIQRSYHVATLQGVGPNFEHSLNQLLTAAEGTVIMLTFDPPEEDPQAGGLLSVSELIPNESFTFDGLTMAKASGNLATLMDLGRPVMHIHLSRDYFNHPRDIARLFSKVPSRSETRTVDEKESEPEMDASLFSERPMEIVTPVSSPEVFYRWLYNPGGFANEGSARSEYFLPVEIQQMSGDAYRLDLLNQWTNDFQMDRALWAVLSDPEKNFHAMKEKIWALHNITNGTMEVAFSQQAGFVADEPQFKSKVQKSVDLFFDILNFNEKSLSLIAWKMIAGASFLKNMRIEGDPLQWVADHYQNMSSPFDFSPSDDIDPGNLDRVLQLTLAKTILHEIKQRLGGVSLEQAMIELNTDFTLTSRKFGPASPAALFKTFIDTEGRFHFYSYPQAIEKLADDQWETHSRGPDNGPSIPKLALMVTQPKPGALPPRLYAALPMFEGVLFGAFAHNPQGTLQLRFPNRDSRAAFQQHFELASDEAVTEQALLHQYVDLIRFLAGEHGISRAKKLIVPEDVRDLFKKHFGINIPGDEANQPRIQEFLKITENIRQSPPVSLPLIGKEVLQNQATRPLSDDEELEITLRYHDMIWALFQPQQMKALSHEGRNFFLWKTIIIPDDIRHFFVKHFQVRLPGSQDDPPSIGDYFNATSNKGIYPLPDLMQLWHNHPQRLARPERPVDSKKAARSETRDLTSPVITPEIKTLFDGARQQVLPLRLEEELEAAKLVEILIELLQRPVYSEKAGILPPVLESRMAQALGDGRASPAAGFESWVNATSSEEGRVLLDPVWLTKLIEKSPYTLYVVLSALQKFQQNRKVTEPLIAVPGEESDLFRKIEQAMLDKKSNLNWNEKDKVRRLLIPQLKQLIQVVADQELNHYIESHNYGVATLLSGRSETRWGGLMAGLPLGARFTADSSQVHDNDLVMIAFLVPALLKAAALVRGITNNPGEQTRLLEPLIWQIIPGARSEARGFVIQSLRYLQQLINQKSVEVSA